MQSERDLPVPASRRGLSVILRGAAVALFALLISGLPVNAILTPSCGFVNVAQHGHYRNYSPGPPNVSYDCRYGIVHGNFGGAYGNMLLEFRGLNSTQGCTSIAVQTFYASGGNIFAAPFDSETVVNQWASSAQPGSGGVFATNFSATRAGSWTEGGQVRVKYINC